VKTRPGTPPGFFACEAAGLRWLRVRGGPRVVTVVDAGRDELVLERLSEVRPTARAARAFGRRLAVLHDAGAPAWGALPPGVSSGFFGPLDDPLPMPGGAWLSWADFYGEARLTPICDQGRARGVFDRADAETFRAVVSRLGALLGAAGDDLPARLHGDLWSGNVLWVPATGGEATGVGATGVGATGGADGALPDDDAEAALIDPAAHGGHREADLAMLALFGSPHLAETIRGYEEAHPLAPGWERRVGLHHLYPLAVQAVLFGGGYVERTRRLLAALAG